MKSFIPIVTTTLLWLGTTSLLATTVHADKVVASQLDLGSPKESGRMLVSTVNDGDTHEETGRMLKKDKKTKSTKKKGKGKSNAPSKKPSSLLLNTIVKGPTTHRAGTQACDVIDESTPPKLNRYQYCTLFGITEANCQSTNAVSGPFYFNRDTGGQGVEFYFDRVLSTDTEDAVCIKITNDAPVTVGGSTVYPTKGFVEFWDDVDQLLKTLGSFSFQWLVKGCGSLTPTNCLGRIYLGIYTRTQASDIVYYDCRYNVYFANAALPGFTTMTWYPFSLDLTTPVNTVAPSTSPTCNLPAGANTLQKAADQNFVLGTKNTCGDKYPYAINLGDSVSNDSGIEVCFKNFRDKIGSKDTTYKFQKVTP